MADRDLLGDAMRAAAAIRQRGARHSHHGPAGKRVPQPGQRPFVPR